MMNYLFTFCEYLLWAIAFWFSIWIFTNLVYGFLLDKNDKNIMKICKSEHKNDELSYFTSHDEKICFHATFLFASPIIINICKSSLLYFLLIVWFNRMFSIVLQFPHFYNSLHSLFNKNDCCFSRFCCCSYS